MEYSPPIETAVTGEWMYDYDHDPYPCLLVRRWNGWAVPAVTREVLERMVADLNAVATQTTTGGLDTLEILPDGSLKVKPEDASMDESIVTPDEDGYYVLDFSWCWETVEGFEDPARPSDAQLRAFKRVRDGGLDISSFNMEVLEDGTHRFHITADLGKRTTHGDREIAVREHVGAVEIDRHGNVTKV